MSWKEILAELKSQPTVSVPTAGKALADLSANAAYRAAQRNALGVQILNIGGKKRVASVAVLRKLGLIDDGKAA
jgi:hypothetical protein